MNREPRDPDRPPAPEQPLAYGAGTHQAPPRRGEEPPQQPPRGRPQRPPQQPGGQQPARQQQPVRQQPVQQRAASQSAQPTQGPQPAHPQGGGPVGATPGQASGARETAPVPAIDVFEAEDAVTVLVDLPGCAEDDIRIRAENDQLSFVAERADDVGGGATAVQRERPTTFRRTVAIPADADVEGATAEYEAGVCTVRFSKTDRRRQREIGFQ